MENAKRQRGGGPILAAVLIAALVLLRARLSVIARLRRVLRSNGVIRYSTLSIGTRRSST